MADQRVGGIGWTDETWNPIRGCSRVSPGCEHCYAEAVASRFCGEGKPYEGLIKIRKDGSRRWSGDVMVVHKHFTDPMSWKRPRRIFVNSMSDLFHPGLDNEDILAVFAVMACSPQHTFQVLTKRPQEMLEWFDWFRNHVLEAAMEDETIDEARIAVLADALGNVIVGHTSRADYDGSDEAAIIKEKLEELYIEEWDTPSRGTVWQHKLPWPLPNVWLGVSTENQKYADERIPLLLKVPAAKHFISAEPLLGPIDLASASPYARSLVEDLDWIIAGCESGADVRMADPQWFRSLRDQCAIAGTPYFLKQARWDGVYIRNDGPHSALKRGSIVEAPTLDGVEHQEFPEAQPSHDVPELRQGEKQARGARPRPAAQPEGDVMERVVVQFSCGAASAVALKLAVEKYGAINVHVINAFIADEDDDNRRFLADVERWLGVRVIVLRDEKYGASPVEVWKRRRFLVGAHGAPCSKALKRDVLDKFWQPGDIDVFGFTVEERDRLDGYVDAHADRRVWAPLIDAEITKPQCFKIIFDAGIELPLMYRQGFSNANCPKCPRGGMGYWNHLRRVRPENFEQVAQIQDILGPGSYFFRDRKTDERISLRMLDPDAGRHEPILSPDCGGMCELGPQLDLFGVKP